MVARGAALGAGQGAIYGGTQAKAGEELSGAGMGALVGGLAGGAVPAVAGAAKSIISPKASTNAALQKVLEEGGTPTIGQALGGTAAKLEEKAMSMPIVGDMIGRARTQAIESIEPAAYNRALGAIGEKLPKGVKGRDAIVHTENALKAKYDDVLNKIGAIIPDEQFGQKVQSLTNMVDSLKMPQAQKDKFLFALDKVQSSIDKDGVLTSDAYKRLESSLGSHAKKLGGSQDIYEADLAPAVQQLRAELQDMLGRQAGDQAKELAKANKGWANFKVLQKAAGGVGADEGKFTPAQLNAAVRAADKSKDKGAFARGNALMQDLSGAAKSVMGSTVPDSGTAGRLLTNVLAAGGAGAAISPVIPAALAAGGVMYTRPVQNALVSMIAKRPDLAPKIAAALEKGSNALVAPSATGGAILANQ
jgi:hypothetical protein